MTEANRNEETADWKDGEKTDRGQDAARPPSLPNRIGRYDVVRVLGKGSFGVVFLAFDETLQRQVAIKTPHPHLLVDAATIDTYRDEARAVSALDHPQIVPVYDVGSDDETPFFIVVKYVEGMTLAARLHQGNRPGVLEAVSMVIQIADAIHYAHTHGVVHRDLKPGNILVDAQGFPFVVDFGLALCDEELDSDPRFVGTPAYCSPEQARGEGHRVDGRSDIFSLGVILYEMLVGRRPFRGETRTQVLRKVISHEPRPPRQIDDTIPRELERICLKALAKQSTDRFTTAKDMADDLRAYLARLQGETTAPLSEEDASGEFAAASSRSGMGATLPSATHAGRSSTFQRTGSIEPIRIVPKGLRAFEAQDADFYVELLPGPRSREGLPESIRFWKSRVDETDAGKTFAVGLLYGPSGCGKSSLVKAGLIPRLEPHVLPIYMEATKRDTESRLTQRLRTSGVELPDKSGKLTLSRMLAAVRRGAGLPKGRKLLIVIDQFEQWLHAHDGRGGATLIDALRQCDGGRVQCVLMVRDDYWMAATRFMRALEVRLLEGQNSGSVDLFHERHARRVLAAFGRAYEELPENPAEMTAEQQRFIEQAIEQLATDGRVVCVHLAIFSEMMKGKPWTPSSLRQLGGAQGVGEAFLDETFNAADASPTRRTHHDAARRVLQALLPDPGTDIRGRRSSLRELRVASGYSSPRRFEELLRLLDNELRLITPVDPPDDLHADVADKDDDDRSSREENRSSTGRDDDDANQGANVPGVDGAYYQLTHDFLVPSLRAWLARKQRETPRGRAEIRLAELTSLWTANPEPRRLPSLFEHLSIRRYTSSNRWSAAEQKMMSAAARKLVQQAALAATALVLLVAAAIGGRQYLAADAEARRADALVDRLFDAQVSETAPIIAAMKNCRRRVEPRLQAALAESPDDDPKRLRAALALAADDAQQVDELVRWILSPETDAETLDVVRTALTPNHKDAADALWRTIDDDGKEREVRLRAACALASLDGESPQWRIAAPQVARWLVDQHTLLAPAWTELLLPAARHLAGPCADLCLPDDHGVSDEGRLNAAHAVSRFTDRDGDLLAELAIEAEPRPFVALLPAIVKQKDSTSLRFQTELAKSVNAQWPDALRPATPFADPAEEIERRMASAGGRIAPLFAYCQTMPLGDFTAMAGRMKDAGYRPVAVRPFASGTQRRVAAVWHRDGGDYEWLSDLTAETLTDAIEERRRSPRWFIADVAPYTDSNDESRFAALWTSGDALFPVIAAEAYAAAPESIHADHWGPLNERGFVPRTNARSKSTDGGTLNSSVRWKLRESAAYSDAWSFRPHEYAERRDGFDTQVDVRLGDETDDTNEPTFAACWWNGVRYESKRAESDILDEHQVQCGELAAAGYIPVSLSVRLDASEGRMRAASVWLRPIVTEEQRDQLARRQAHAAIGLFHLGQQEPVFRYLADEQNPYVRHWLINRLAALEVPSSALAARLPLADTDAERRALILALSQYRPDDLSASNLAALHDRVRSLHGGTLDAGTRAAADLLLRRWDLANRETATSVTAEKPETWDAAESAAHEAERRWFVTPHGFTMSIIAANVEFVRGSTGAEPVRNHVAEMPERVRIERPFAIADREVSVADYRLLFPDADYLEAYSPHVDAPMNNINWFDAARYCRRLSELEGIPESEMCFPEVDLIVPGVKLPDDYLRRRGYRLPTDAEWEWACRAATVGSRPFGWSPNLLDHYAWTAENSSFAAHPVASLLPNDWGLFDMLGNSMEMTTSIKSNENVPFGESVQIDQSPTEPFSANALIRCRGGATLYQPTTARSAWRDEHDAESKRPYLGFRIVRTIAGDE